MKIRFAEPTLTGLDGLGGICLVLTTFTDDRPLRGLAGQVDWRLNGRLSRWLLDEFVDAHYREVTLTPLAGQLPFQRLLLVGLGSRQDYTAERFAEMCVFCFSTLARMGVTEFAMEMPGRVGLDIGLRQALVGWRDALAASFDAAQLATMQICVVEPASVQRELVEPMRAMEGELHEFALQRTAGHQAGPGAQRPTPKSQVVPAEPPSARRGWQSGVVRLSAPVVDDLEEGRRGST